MKPTLLLIDDDADATESMARVLTSVRSDAYSIVTANSVAAAQKVITRSAPAVLIADLCIDERTGIESGFALVKWCRSHSANTRIIVLTGHGSKANGVRAMELGAAAFLEKPADIRHLIALVDDAISQSHVGARLEEVSAALKGELECSFVGSSDQAQQVREEISFAAFSPQSVIILGETGTGKGLCAKLMHQLGTRAAEPFIRFQPTITTADMVASELFGHTKGAFTGAHDNRDGLLKEAHKGTFFLDEVDAVSPAVQVLLLGALQDRTFRPVGANREVSADFRLICASNQPEELLAQGALLRRDFFHRIAQLPVRLPPLRERISDIPELTASVFRRIRNEIGAQVRAVDKSTIAELKRYTWPGNVREFVSVLEGAIYRAAYQRQETVTTSHLRLAPSQQKLDTTGNEFGISPALDFQERVRLYKRKLVEEALAKTHGNQVEAAKLLGIDRSTLHRIMS